MNHHSLLLQLKNTTSVNKKKFLLHFSWGITHILFKAIITPLSCVSICYVEQPGSTRNVWERIASLIFFRSDKTRQRGDFFCHVVLVGY